MTFAVGDKVLIVCHNRPSQAPVEAEVLSVARKYLFARPRGGGPASGARFDKETGAEKDGGFYHRTIYTPEALAEKRERDTLGQRLAFATRPSNWTRRLSLEELRAVAAIVAPVADEEASR
jgi:hypothetical protein